MNREEAMKELGQIIASYAQGMLRDHWKRYGIDSWEFNTSLEHYLEMAKALGVEEDYREHFHLCNMDYVLGEYKKKNPDMTPPPWGQRG